jgi:cation-transporting ATPase E
MTTAASGEQAAPITGLSLTEVRERQARGEANVRRRYTSRSYARILAENALTPINVILFAISIALVVIGFPGDAVMTGGLVAFNVVVGVIQESRAKRRLEQISLLAQPQATVLREGQELVIKPEEIVLGDVLVIRQGDQVEVDAVVLQEDGLTLDESLLTGESDRVRKRAGDHVFSGTFCMTGSALVEADQVGPGSMAQKLEERARSFRVAQTPLQKEANLVILGMALTVSLLGLVVAGSFVRIYGHLPLEETVRAAAVVVALVPQGLVFMITVTYSIAAIKVANAGALVQRLNAVESMSGIDVLCLDKTGTLTTNDLTVEDVAPASLERERFQSLLGDFAASASMRNRTTAAILEAFPGRERAIVGEIVFDSIRKWSAVSAREEGFSGTYVLGAPEALVTGLELPRELEDRARDWTSQGLRVLLLAHSPEVVVEGERDEVDAELPPRLTALGLVCLRDQLRQEAAATVKHFETAGIALKVLSGDHPETVSALARQIGIHGANLPGSALREIEPQDLAPVVEETAVFGRITPDDKERILRALQHGGHYVAMIGDGVNDVPALKQANVAVAPKSGSPAARGVSDIVLLQDSFGVLPGAFLEGQRIRNGMQTVLRIFLIRTFSITLLVLLAALLNDPFPSTPRQSGLLSVLTVGVPALMVALWAQPARTRRYLMPAVLSFVLPAALTIAVASAAVFHIFYRETGDLLAARTAVTLLGIMCGLALLPFVAAPRPGLSALGERRILLLTAGLTLAWLLFVSLPVARDFYELVVLSPLQYGAILVAFGIWAIVQLLVWRLDPAAKLRDWRWGHIPAGPSREAEEPRA